MEKSKKSINVEGGFLFCGGWNFSKSVSVGPTFIREMRVVPMQCRVLHLSLLILVLSTFCSLILELSTFFFGYTTICTKFQVCFKFGIADYLYTQAQNVCPGWHVYEVKQPQEKWGCDFHDDAPPLSFQLQVAEVIFS